MYALFCTKMIFVSLLRLESERVKRRAGHDNLARHFGVDVAKVGGEKALAGERLLESIREANVRAVVSGHGAAHKDEVEERVDLVFAALRGLGYFFGGSVP